MHQYELKSPNVSGKNKRKLNVLNEIINSGNQPIIELIEDVNYDESDRRELFWIKKLFLENHPLVNRIPHDLKYKVSHKK